MEEEVHPMRRSNQLCSF